MKTNPSFKQWFSFLVFGLFASTACAQQTQITIPDGPRHFIVLVDSSWSMVANSLKPVPVGTKRQALASAERYLTHLLYSPNKGEKAAWYRPNRDLVSIVHYGIDTESRADQAYIRLKNARLDEDYARVVIRANPNLTRDRFQRAIHPTSHTNLNVLAWALPVGMEAARVPSKKPVQETYVILLNDMQMNDGSVVLEANTLGMHLSPGVREELGRKNKLFSNSVRLTDRNGLSGVWLQKTFGQDLDLVAITIFKAVPTTTNQAAGALTKLRPLDSLSISGSASGLQAHLSPEEKLIGSKAALRIQSDRESRVNEKLLTQQTDYQLGKVSGGNARAYLLVSRTASNPLLGSQTFQVLYEQPVMLPGESMVRSFGLGFVLLALIGSMLGWIYYNIFQARHFFLYLPGYVSSFALPPIAQRVNSRHRTRVPLSNGEVAAVLVLPSRLIRRIFYRNTTLHWDPRLRVPKLAADCESYSVLNLPRSVEFMWQDEPPSSGEFELWLDRKMSNGRNQRAQVSVRFLSQSLLTRSELN